MIENKYEQAATTNALVNKSFIMGISAHSANLSTDGKVLRSYHYYELAQWCDDKVILRKGELYSKTTSKHMTQLVKELKASKVEFEYSTEETPQGEKYMVLKTSDAAPIEENESQGARYMGTTFGEITEQEYLEVKNEQVREARRTLGHIL